MGLATASECLNYGRTVLFLTAARGAEHTEDLHRHRHISSRDFCIVWNGNLPGMNVNHHVMTIRVWQAAAPPQSDSIKGSRSGLVDAFGGRGRLGVDEG